MIARNEPFELPESLRERASSMNFDSTISRKLVHRNYIDHVLVTDVQTITKDHFLCAARLPQMHGFFNEQWKTPCCSLLAITEIARQACIALSHEHLDIPAGTAQIVRHAGGLMEAFDAPAVRRPRSADFIMEITFSNHQYRRGGGLTALNAEYSGYSQLVRVFHGSGEWMFVPRKMYERLRYRAAPPVLGSEASGMGGKLSSPEAVGRLSADHVVITTPVSINGGSAFAADLVADPTHPFFFEHELDHVSGMLLLEGCKQLAVNAAAELCGYAPMETAFQCYSATFFRFAGLEVPVRLQASIKPAAEVAPHGPGVVFAITASQDEVVLATIEVGVAPREPAAGGAQGQAVRG